VQKRLTRGGAHAGEVKVMDVAQLNLLEGQAYGEPIGGGDSLEDARSGLVNLGATIAP